MASFQPMALGIKPVEIESPLNAMAKIQQMRGLQQQESLNQMKMDEYGRGVQQQEALNQMLRGGVSDRTSLLGYGEGGRAAYKALGEEETRKQTASKTAAELIDNRLKRSREMLSFVRTPDQYMNWLTGELQDPVLGPQLKTIGVNPATIAADLQKALQQPGGFESFLQQSAMTVDEFAKMNKPQLISQDMGTGGRIVSVNPQGGPASVVPGSEFVKTEPPPKPTGTVAEYREAVSQGYKGSILDYRKDIAIAGRAPAAAPAVTVTQVVDPSDPSRMITVDARRYQGGGVGSPGVIGVGGKEPSAQARIVKAETGKTQLSDEIDNLRAAYTTLDKMRSIPSTERGTVSNVLSGIAATGVGQATGRLVGTEAQTERDVIAGSKMRLLNAIKQATGMSAQQLNSNMELQSWLKAVSDPSQSVQAVNRILTSIEDTYGLGGSTSPKPKASTPSPSKPAPVGETKSVSVNGSTVQATRAPNGKFYVKQPNGKYAEVVE